MCTSYSSGGFGVCRARYVFGSSWMWTVVDIYVLGAILKSYTGELLICTWSLTWKQLNVNCGDYIRQWRLWRWSLIYLCRGTYLAGKLDLCGIYWWLCVVIYTSMKIMMVVVNIPVYRNLPGREAGPVQNLWWLCWWLYTSMEIMKVGVDIPV